MKNQPPNPFEGIKRLRLPSIHMITAHELKFPLIDAIAGNFFLLLHDKFPHTCLMKSTLVDIRLRARKIAMQAQSGDELGLTTVFGLLGEGALAGEEWSYLPASVVKPFYTIAQTAILETQRWIARGWEQPHMTGYGKLVLCNPIWSNTQVPSPEDLWLKKAFARRMSLIDALPPYFCAILSGKKTSRIENVHLFLREQSNFIYQLLAQGAIEQTQRWISGQIEPSVEVGHNPFVLVPKWAMEKNQQDRSIPIDTQRWYLKVRKELEQ